MDKNIKIAILLNNPIDLKSLDENEYTWIA